MRTPCAIALCFASLLLTACSFSGLAPAAAEHRVEVEGESFTLTEITASTWTAAPRRAGQPLTERAAMRSQLLNTIEKTSGCKVVSSDVSRQGQQLDAQVACRPGLKN